MLSSMFDRPNPEVSNDSTYASTRASSHDNRSSERRHRPRPLYHQINGKAVDDPVRSPSTDHAMPHIEIPTMLGINGPIAIIGMVFNFPQGSNTSDSLWKMLIDRRSACTEFPRKRFNVDGFWNPDPKMPSKMTTRNAHFLRDDIANFDAGFFSMPSHEVGSMDPQQRGLMETTYHAFENAGIPLEQVAGSSTSVYVGCFTNGFSQMQFKDLQNLPNWFFDLRAEILYIDTVCSSGMVALALACQSLASGQSQMAAVGGANTIFGPEFNITLSNLNFLSPVGSCKSFDASGDGYGRGECFAALILQPVSQALAHGNPIRAVTRSVGLNPDGHTSGEITQPSRERQLRLIRDTYQKAGLDMSQTRMFEAHGTETAIGDPIEARAIGEAFLPYRSTEDPMFVGALKGNLGHLEGTSALASVVKTVLALERGVILPNTNFETLNPNIDAEFLKLAFPLRTVPWPQSAHVRRASVNSFGFGGPNSHAVIEAADDYLRSIGCE